VTNKLKGKKSELKKKSGELEAVEAQLKELKDKEAYLKQDIDL
jgi:hypothetical protein